MPIVIHAARGVTTFIGVLCFMLVSTFVFLAYANPTQLDTLVHQAHEVIPAVIDRVTNSITSKI